MGVSKYSQLTPFTTSPPIALRLLPPRLEDEPLLLELCQQPPLDCECLKLYYLSDALVVERYSRLSVVLDEVLTPEFQPQRIMFENTMYKRQMTERQPVH